MNEQNNKNCPKNWKNMDIKKEINDDEAELMDEIEHDIKAMSDVCTTENEDTLGAINNFVKTEKVGDMDFSGSEVGLFGNTEISFSLKTEEDSDENENIVNVSDDFYESKGAFLIGECSDEESDQNENIGNRSNDTVTETNHTTKFTSAVDMKDNDLEDDYIDNDTDTDSYDDEQYTSKIKIIIKKEMMDGFEDEDKDEKVKKKEIDFGRKTKKAKTFICKLCNKAFTSECRLKRHKLQLHPGGAEEVAAREGKYQCEICEKRFSSQSRLTLHFVTHTGEKPYACDICDQKFSHPTNKRRHMMTHTGDKPFLCVFCGKSFPVKHYLKDHLVKHTGERPHECKICFMKFAHRFSLKQHELLKHPGGKLNYKDSYEERPFSCDECGKKFTQQSSLKIHERLHTGSKPYKCDKCDASFIRSDALLRHKFEHTGRKPFQCDQCDKTFTSGYILKQHQNVHTGDRRQQCEHCGVELANKESLARHMLRHSGESMLECRVCHKKFLHEKTLQRHQKEKCEEKMFYCEDCNYSNTSESKLKRHMLKHKAHKSLECSLCHNKFTYPSNLKRHMKIHDFDQSKKRKKKETLIPADDVGDFVNKAVNVKHEDSNFPKYKRAERKRENGNIESEEVMDEVRLTEKSHAGDTYLETLENDYKKGFNENKINKEGSRTEGCCDRNLVYKGQSVVSDLDSEINSDKITANDNPYIIQDEGINIPNLSKRTRTKTEASMIPTNWSKFPYRKRFGVEEFTSKLMTETCKKETIKSTGNGIQSSEHNISTHVNLSKSGDRKIEFSCGNMARNSSLNHSLKVLEYNAKEEQLPLKPGDSPCSVFDNRPIIYNVRRNSHEMENLNLPKMFNSGNLHETSVETIHLSRKISVLQTANNTRLTCLSDPQRSFPYINTLSDRLPPQISVPTDNQMSHSSQSVASFTHSQCSVPYTEVMSHSSYSFSGIQHPHELEVEEKIKPSLSSGLPDFAGSFHSNQTFDNVPNTGLELSEGVKLAHGGMSMNVSQGNNQYTDDQGQLENMQKTESSGVHIQSENQEHVQEILRRLYNNYEYDGQESND